MFTAYPPPELPEPKHTRMRDVLARLIVAGLLAMVASACSGPDTPSLSLEPVDAPAEANTFAPRLSVDADDRLLLSYLKETDEGHALQFVRYNDGAWASPQTVAEGADWFANWADTPGVRSVDEWLFAHWLVRSGPGTFHYDIHAAWSSDGGATWSDPFILHGESRQAEHGFLSSVVLDDGALGVAWLDGRDTVSDEEPHTSEHDHHAHATDQGAMSLRWARFEPGATEPTRDMELDDRVCDCCMTASVREGADVRILYRDRTETEIRDIASARITPSGYENEGRVAQDDWEISACPVEGPAAARRGATTDAIWFTRSEGAPKVFWAQTENDSANLGSPMRIDQGDPAGRVGAVAVDERRTLLTWIEAADSGNADGHIMARMVRASDVSDASELVPISTQRASGFPVLARTEAGAWIAWTDVSDDERRVQVGQIDSI